MRGGWGGGGVRGAGGWCYGTETSRGEGRGVGC